MRNLYTWARELRSTSSPDPEELKKFFKARDEYVRSAQFSIDDYLELSPIQWPSKWQTRNK